MPSLAPMMRGIAEGKEAMAEIGASLQIARIGSGSSDEAGNNLRNFLTKIFARDTQKQFADNHPVTLLPAVFQLAID